MAAQGIDEWAALIYKAIEEKNADILSINHKVTWTAF